MMLRSLLYVPGSSPRFLEKAHQRGADAIIIDLEDAVAVNEKDAARAALARTVPMVGRGGAQVIVRINTHDEMTMLADASAACEAGARALYIPKVSSPEILHRLDRHLQPLEAAANRSRTWFAPLIEDPAGLLNATSIAAGPRVFALSAGGEDLATSMGAQPTPEVLRVPKLMIHYAAKAAGVLSFGLLRSTADYADKAALSAAIREAKDFGFDGATCIHPSVVPLLNDGFSPSEEELDRARRLITAADDAAQAGIGAFTFEGKFVDLPIVTRARALLARSTG
ncbi:MULTISPECIES: CoA ester lyase [unclassified Ensifer]|uniref:HpcH/HpaI aldolase/citrate lyase family protein n=1 Tax=unclassified Ensifer TaxID=2633371 RepID=UPI00081340AD|nr:MULTISPECIES: CoA ester lyase [unclassified Ensifer]OCP15878.1 citrate lyase [Ensifer sp. LC384]OCP19948.1 citrate lyase [Ensifer sp. LC54]OCP35373.1 citrate lyase [Ensifer sp. LC163]